MPTTPEEFAASDRGCVVAPAGCGKTRLIADAITALPDTRQLILTHTHAGVHALRHILHERGVAPSRVRVGTIDGFALRWAAAYPKTSGLTASTPRDDEWAEVHPAAQQILQWPLTVDHLRRVFDGLFVDEYQDCTHNQHRMIETVAEALPTRVVGDPMQGIFDFRPDDPLVEFEEHVFPTFQRLEDLTVPHRWADFNPDLGHWLHEARLAIEAGDSPDFESGPISVLAGDPAVVKARCKELVGEGGSVVVIRAQAPQAHGFARGLGGLYQSMEEMECRDLFTTAEALSSSVGTERAAILYGFSQKIVAGLGNTGTLGGRIDSYREGEIPTILTGKFGAVVAALNDFALSGDPAIGRTAVQLLVDASGKKPFRRELLTEMDRSLAYAASHPAVSLSESAWRVRDVTRRRGRRPWRLTVSRTLLVKGLEYDHSVLMDVAQLEPKHLYVALTRGSRSLAVVSSE